MTVDKCDLAQRLIMPKDAIEAYSDVGMPEKEIRRPCVKTHVI